MRSPLISLLCLALGAQEGPLTKAQERERFHPLVPTPEPSARRKAAADRMALAARSPFRAIPWRCIGPMGQGGRVVALAVDARRPEAWIAAFATGGLWMTTNDGGSWTSLFNAPEAFAIGDVAVAWGEPGVPKTIWVGTGEPNASRSSYMGAGLFRSDDGGATWRASGLPDSHRIARLLLHPTDPKTLYVAAQGPLYTEGGERGVYKSTDGGATWSSVLPGGPRTGAIDLLMDWSDPETLYAALWEKDRKPWNFLESGPGSAIHKSTDGGRTWTRLGGGFPQGDSVGRIGLAQSRQDPKKLYAFLDHQALRPKEETSPYADPDQLTPKKLAALTKEQLQKLEPKPLAAYLKAQGYPDDLQADQVLADLKSGALAVKDLLAWLGDADRALFDTDIVGPELYGTTDGGASWTRTHPKRLDEFTYTYGYYFGQVRVDPKDDRRVYLLGMPAALSTDGGATFRGINGEDWGTVHPDHHALWIDPHHPGHLVLGNDGGLNVSLDAGETWRALKNLAVGQFYTVTTDQAEPYRVYGGLQDNGVMTGPPTALKPRQARDGWRAIQGGDGAYVQVNPKDNATVYAASQFGGLSRLKGGERKAIRPKHPLKHAPYRFNWLAPVVMSPHGPDILYAGTQHVLRSLDRGDTWTEVSPDLSTARKPQVAGGGDVPFGTISALAESPKRFGLLYAGTDDGRVHVSRDGGFAWKDVSRGLPPGRWVTRLEPSRFDEGVVYVTLTGYRRDESAAYLFKSSDYGSTWASLKANLPEEGLNVVREDPTNPKLLYAGSEFAVYASLDGGLRWDVLGAGLPTVPTHDLAVQAKAGDLVAGTHGRSAWVAPVQALQRWTPDVRAEEAHLFDVKKLKAEAWWKRDRPTWFLPRESDPVALWFHVKAGGPATLHLEDPKGEVQRAWSLTATPGLNRVDWDLQIDPKRLPGLPEGRRPFVRPGTYSLVLEAGGKSMKRELVVETAKEEVGGEE